MKFTSDRKNMYEILKPLLKIAKRNAVIRELECVFLDADENDGFLYMTAANTECVMKRKLKSDIETGGRFAVNAAVLSDILSLLGGETVTFVCEKDGIVKITSLECTYTIPVLTGNIYPKQEIPIPEKTVNAKGIKQLYAKTASTASVGDMSKSIEGIHFDIDLGRLRAVSCSGTCVSVAEKKYDCGGKLSFTLPKISALHLACALDLDDEIKIGASGKKIVFIKDDMIFSAQPFEREYVNVDALISSVKPAYTAKTEFDELKKQVCGICSVASLGGEKAYVKLSFNESTIKASVETDIAVSSGEARAVCIKGEREYSFFYKAKHLENIFRTLEGTLIVQADERGYLFVMSRDGKYMTTPVLPAKTEKKKRGKKTEKAA